MQPIYIADDSADQRYLFGYLLKCVNPKYPIKFFERSQQLLDSLALAFETGRGVPLAVFLDLKMPDIDGLQALKVITHYNDNRSKNAEVPVIIYSSYSDQKTVQKCFDTGAFGFIKKPVALNDLKNLLLLIEP